MVRDLKASDWPMYSADAARNGYTTDHLPARLKIDWRKKADSPHSQRGPGEIHECLSI